MFHNRTYAVIFQPLFAWGIEENCAETLTLTGMKKNQNVIGKIGTPHQLLHKHSDGKNKAPLRMAMTGILPRETLDNFHKRGWNAPFDRWLNRYLLPYLQEILEKPSSRQKEIYDLKYIRKLIEHHRCGAENHMMFFWQFLGYELWYANHFGD